MEAVICCKYGLQMQFLLANWAEVRLLTCSIVVVDLIALGREYSMIVAVFKNGLACQVGGGDVVRFWGDLWVGDDVPLQEQLPHVFALSLNKSAAVSDVGRVENDG